MRNAFIRALTDVAARDERIVFLTGDLGYKLFDDFAQRYPCRFMNVGVAEATMAGVAAGLALEGKKPFIYSLVPFATLRCYEQNRTDICYHNADVTVVGVGGGGIIRVVLPADDRVVLPAADRDVADSARQNVEADTIE